MTDLDCAVRHRIEQSQLDRTLEPTEDHVVSQAGTEDHHPKILPNPGAAGPKSRVAAVLRIEQQLFADADRQRALPVRRSQTDKEPILPSWFDGNLLPQIDR